MAVNQSFYALVYAKDYSGARYGTFIMRYDASIPDNVNTESLTDDYLDGRVGFLDIARGCRGIKPADGSRDNRYAWMDVINLLLESDNLWMSGAAPEDAERAYDAYGFRTVSDPTEIYSRLESALEDASEEGGAVGYRNL